MENSKREWKYILRLCKGKMESKEIFKVIICSTLYNIWRERNQRKFTNVHTTADRLAKDIMRKVIKHLTLVLTELTDYLI